MSTSTYSEIVYFWGKKWFLKFEIQQNTTTIELYGLNQFRHYQTKINSIIKKEKIELILANPTIFFQHSIDPPQIELDLINSKYVFIQKKMNEKKKEKKRSQILEIENNKLCKEIQKVDFRIQSYVNIPYKENILGDDQLKLENKQLKQNIESLETNLKQGLSELIFFSEKNIEEKQQQQQQQQNNSNNTNDTTDQTSDYSNNCSDGLIEEKNKTKEKKIYKFLVIANEKWSTNRNFNYFAFTESNLCATRTNNSKNENTHTITGSETYFGVNNCFKIFIKINQCKNTDFKKFSNIGFVPNVKLKKKHAFQIGWVINTNGSICQQNQGWEPTIPQMPKFKRGDLLALILNLQHGTIGFELNSIFYGWQFSNLNKKLEYKIAIDLFNIDDSLSIL
ncbi:hypothetical protein M0812_02026 [Anaeramoeba flamelloides]|uniref:B30.2/SPRY domain-containing protein n=1 Tax=Anaeramoeba flamelloides TaxID=1746091 RepID=A0AAV7Z194_9EUKA|nr:hypothetical protein M0812_02026 [Anaeramoeba flamelloides]